MTQNTISKDTPLTPFVIGRLIRRTTLTLTTNFGQQPFQSLTESVLQCIADAQAEFYGNPERLPVKWSRYPLAPSVSYEQDDFVVMYKGSFRYAIQFADSDY